MNLGRSTRGATHFRNDPNVSSRINMETLIEPEIGSMSMAQPQTRVPVDFDLRVWGMSADGHAFSQHARARNISTGGALLSDIERDLKIGDTIGIQNGEKKARCRVVWSTNTLSADKVKVGVQLLNQQECPWTTLLGGAGESASVFPRNHRRWDRHKINVLITLHTDWSTIPIRVTASDISASGCYVETISPFPISTAFSTDLAFGVEKLTTRTIVRSCDPQVGMGIEFVGLKQDEQQRFQNYLRAMDPYACSIEQSRILR